MNRFADRQRQLADKVLTEKLDYAQIHQLLIDEADKFESQAEILTMSDVIDRANEHAALVLEQNIQAARKPANRVSAFECEIVITQYQKPPPSGDWLHLVY